VYFNFENGNVPVTTTLLLLLLLTIAPSCFRLALAGLLPPAAAPAGFTPGGSLALPVTTSNSVGSELICLNSFDLWNIRRSAE
jgi:hypothetical protein